jgi:hypothetical protein
MIGIICLKISIYKETAKNVTNKGRNSWSMPRPKRSVSFTTCMLGDNQRGGRNLEKGTVTFFPSPLPPFTSQLANMQWN